MKYKDLYTIVIDEDFLDQSDIPPHALLRACDDILPKLVERSAKQIERFRANYRVISAVCERLDKRMERLDAHRLETIRQNLASRVGVNHRTYVSTEQKDALERQEQLENLLTGIYESELDARNKLEAMYQIEYPDFLIL